MGQRHNGIERQTFANAIHRYRYTNRQQTSKHLQMPESQNLDACTDTMHALPVAHVILLPYAQILMHCSATTQQPVVCWLQHRKLVSGLTVKL